ncbi:MAG: hypothetical protein ACI4NG_02275 [Candidatus Gallimonas sp.]
MTVRQFFKSAAFRSLAVLLAIVIVAGGLLAICNDLFYVSAEEKFARTLMKIYGKAETVEETIELTEENKKQPNAVVNYAYRMGDGNLLVQATGKGGFNGGTVTLWVVVLSDHGAFGGVGKVVYETNTKQTYLSKFSDSFYDHFSAYNDRLKAGETFSVAEESGSVRVVNTGASLSSTAMCNAVNGAISFCKTVVFGEEAARETYLYESFINLGQSVITPESGKVSYRLVMKANGNAPSFTAVIVVENGAIASYSTEGAISTGGYDANVDDSFKNGSFFLGKRAADVEAMLDEDRALRGDALSSNGLKTGATESSASFVRAAAFATANYELFLNGEGGLHE